MAGASALAIAVAGAALTGGAMAAEVSEEGAAEIRAELQAWMDDYLFNLPESPYIQTGTLEVTAGDDGYDILLPAIDVVTPEPVISIDPIEVFAAPVDDGLYEATWVIPSLIEIGEEGDDQVVNFTIANQSAEGLFASAYQTFLNMDWVLEGVDVRPSWSDDLGYVAFETVSAEAASTNIEGDVFDYDSLILLGGMDVQMPHTGPIAMDEFAIEASATSADFAVLTEMGRSMNSIAQQAENANDPMAMFTAMATVMRDTTDAFDGMSGLMRVHGLSFDDEYEGFSLANAGVEVFTGGLLGPAASLGVRAGMDGLTLVQAPLPPHLMPQEVSAGIVLEGLPTEQIQAAFATFLESAAQVGPDMAMMNFGMGLQQAVMTGGATLEIEEILFINEVTRFEMVGTVTPDPTAAFAMVAEARIEFVNMEGLIAELQQIPPAAPAVQGLTLLQTMGELAESEDGRSLRTFDLEVTAAGQVLMNGNDMTPMLGGLMQ